MERLDKLKRSLRKNNAAQGCRSALLRAYALSLALKHQVSAAVKADEGLTRRGTPVPGHGRRYGVL